MTLDRDKDASLIVESLYAGYGASPIVRGVSLRVPRGAIVCIIGPNGSGKSTLLKAVAGVLLATGGVVKLPSGDVTKLGTEGRVRRGLGYVPQVNDVFATLTVAENLQAGAYLLKKRAALAACERVYEIFPNLATLRNRRAGTLSGGEHKMLALGRALTLEPEILLLDEPSANLSPNMVDSVLKDQVPRLAASGVGVLLVEQRAREALDVAEWGHVMVGGVVRTSGKTTSLATEHLRDLFFGVQRPDTQTCNDIATLSERQSRVFNSAHPDGRS